MPLSCSGTILPYRSTARFTWAVILSCCLWLPVFPERAGGAAPEDHTWSRYAKRQQAFDDCVGYAPLPAPEPAPASPKKSYSGKKRAPASRKKQAQAPSKPQTMPNIQEPTPVLVPVMINPICPDNMASGAQGQGAQTNMTPRVVQGSAISPQKIDIPSRPPAATALPEIVQRK